MEEKKEIYISIRKKPWKDVEDNNYVYEEGNIYPRKGLEVSKKRIKELSSTKNKIGEILIKKTEITEESKIEDDSDELDDSEKSEVKEIEKLEENEDNTEENNAE